jgi:hypothetical protein
MHGNMNVKCSTILYRTQSFVDPNLNPEDFAATWHLCFVFKVLTSGLKFVLMQLSLSDKRLGPSVNGIVLFEECQPTAVLPNMALTDGQVQ